MTFKHTQTIAGALIGIGLMIFVTAAALAGYVYATSSTAGNSGAPMVAVMMLLGAYYVLTFCNVIGGVAILVSQKSNAGPVPPWARLTTIASLIVQIIPAIYWTVTN